MGVYEELLQSVEQEFRLQRTIKVGARGSVYALQHAVSGRQYIFRQFQGRSDAYRRLLAIQSPNLPEIYEVGEQNGQTAVLEEYVQGDTLYEVLRGNLLSTNDAKNITRQLCNALWILHAQGIVHRDIKPENVILRGSDAVLIDFDAARIFKSENQKDTVVLGTTGYAAPEQYGIAQSDERADIYSLGVMLNIMLIGKHPSKELAAGHLGRVVEKCTMTTPRRRYANVIRLWEAL